MTRARLICDVCGEPIRKANDNFTAEFTAAGSSQIERAWHHHCRELAIPPDSPFQAAVQKAKQAIADAWRLGPHGYENFCNIVTAAMVVQRVEEEGGGLNLPPPRG